MALITCKDLSFAYGGDTVLRGVNFAVNAGDYLCVVGENGSGKSTLMKGLLGLKEPETGTIEYGDGLKRSEIGYLPQQTALQRDFPASVFEVVLSGRLNSLGRRFFYSKEDKREAERNLERMGMLEFKSRCYQELSGGQQQRVAIARALATDPKVLLCDEATSALDPKTTRQILELIRDINQKLNITVVIITHQMSVVKEVCSHVAILDDGCVAESGMVGTVFAAPKSEAGRRLVFPGGADAQVYNPQDEKLVRLVFKDSKTTSIPLIARLAAEEGVFCNVISASTQKLSETVYGSMMLGIPSTQYDKAVAFIHNVANVQVEEVDHHVQ